jgi:hypothetical protein
VRVRAPVRVLVLALGRPVQVRRLGQSAVCQGVLVVLVQMVPRVAGPLARCTLGFAVRGVCFLAPIGVRQFKAWGGLWCVGAASLLISLFILVLDLLPLLYGQG